MCNPSPQEAEAKGSRVRGPLDCITTLSQKPRKDGVGEMAQQIRTLAIYKFEGPNSDPSTHCIKPGMVPGSPVTLTLWKAEAGGSV